MADTMMVFKNGNLQNFLTKEELRAKAPYIFAKKPTRNVSDRYVFADTEMVIDDMAKMGWGVVDAKQQKNNRTRNGGDGVASFHMVAFQNKSIAIYKTDENGEVVVDENGNGIVDSYPQIILTNSHDAKNSFVFRIGLFRLVCSNGLIVATHEFDCQKIRHINYTFDDLRRVVIESVNRVAEQTKVMVDMQRRKLTEAEMIRLAEESLKIRRGEQYKAEKDTIEEILRSNRQEDEDNNLWVVYNRIQENLIKGNFSTKNAKGKVRKARGIKSISKDIDINTRLFQLANTYRLTA